MNPVLTDKPDIEKALRASGNKFVSVHLDNANMVYEGVKVIRVIETPDPAFIVAGDGIPEVCCKLSNIRNCQIGH